MERVNFGISTKNIPIASNDHYLKQLVAKSETFIRNLRWKTFHFKNERPKEFKETFGFKTRNTPPADADLIRIEEDITNMIRYALTTTIRNIRLAAASDN